MTNIWIEILGWLGAISLLWGYYLIQTKRVKHDNTLYLILNIFGSFGLFVNTVYHRAYPSMVTNFLWMMIGGFTAFSLSSGERPLEG
jgi:fluoride ion exporter CrcB/FEX